MQLNRAVPLLNNLLDLGFNKAYLAKAMNIDMKTLSKLLVGTTSEVITRDEVCRQYGISNETIASLIKDKKITNPQLLDDIQVFKASDIREVLK